MHPCPQDLSARLYHETDYSSLFVEELTQWNSNLTAISSVKYATGLFFIDADFGGGTLYVLLAENKRIFRKVQTYHK